MSFLSLRRYRHLQTLTLCRGKYTCRASIRETDSGERYNLSNNKRKWYTLGAVTTSALGFWAWKGNNSRQQALGPLAPNYFIPAVLTSSEKTSENTRLLRLAVPPDSISGVSNAFFRPIWSIYVKDSDIQVERPYTPLEAISSGGEMTFWIKKYENGEVGRWLHRRTPGEKIEIRGPGQTWAWQDDTWDNVVMVAGGTGIAPFHQLLHILFSNPTKTPKTKFTLLHSYRSSEELPPPVILDNLSTWKNKNPQNLHVHTFVDSRDGELEKDELIIGRINKDVLKSTLRNTGGRTIVLVCGPDPMINALAGPKGRNESQGPLGGALGSLNDGTFQVWKL
ncbi:ferredoxin reductase-like protein [Sanghuangporus baumii]|uniref:Ferredoxin reductase-like protein n=1 Tax=Sanghuangporus baumii TaxID=108892 RepID=A0A9Q5I4E3_SANBA|nr:ferredoxin reductase-like protein [Sanghuangporus baumii]